MWSLEKDARSLCLPTSNVLLSDVLTSITKFENFLGKFL